MAHISDPLDLDGLLAHGGFVRNVARGLVLDENAVDDVVQETFLRALRGGPSRAGRLSAWLRSVTRNVVFSTRRADQSRRRLEAAVEPVLPAGAAQWPEEILRREELRRRVVQAVFSLEEPYRAVILLRYYEALSPDLIAERLAVPVRTVWTRLHRARALLRVKLAREYEGDRSWMRGLVVLAGFDPKALAAGGASLMLGAQAVWIAVILLVTAGLVPLLLLDGPGDSGAAVGLVAPNGEGVLGAERRSREQVVPRDAVRLAESDPVPVDSASAISCRVLDPTGTPVGHAVAYGRSAGTSEDWSELAEVDAEGFLAIEPEGHGPMDLEFRADAFIPARRTSVWPGSSVEVMLHPGIPVR
jgi:RNA polymerase sigma-70 factor (ECF subfamily)